VSDFHELSREKKWEFIDSLDESDMAWLEFLKQESGGRAGVAMERLYRLKNAANADKGEEEK